MKRVVDIRPAARTDILDVFDYLSETSPAVAARFLIAVRTSVSWLAETPGVGSVVDFSPPELGSVRHWRVRDFTNYLIFYQETDDGIVVVRVVHGARDLPRLFRAELTTDSPPEPD